MLQMYKQTWIKQIFQDILQIEQLVEDSVINQNLMKKLFSVLACAKWKMYELQ